MRIFHHGSQRQRLLASAGTSASALVVLLAASCSSSGSSTQTAASPAANNSAVNSGQPTQSSGSGASAQTPAPIESNPPGDIADNVAYVSYRSPDGRYSFVHPEGWSSLVHAGVVTFTDKLNGIAASSTVAAGPPSVTSAKQQIAALQATQPAFELRAIRSAALPAGDGVLILFRRNSVPDAVTGKVFRDEVNRYEVYRAGHLTTLDLYGAVGSDNVDPYTKISQSLRLS